jgi:hypothetical protein
MTKSRSREIPPALVRQIVIKYLAETGIPVLDLLRADVHFLDADDNDVPLDRVGITWDED